MASIDLPSFALGAVAVLALVLLIRVLRRDMDPVRTSGNVIATTSRSFPTVTRQSPPRAAVSGTTNQRITELLRQGRKIEAIKLYREQTGVGLREAKEAVDALESRYGTSPRR